MALELKRPKADKGHADYAELTIRKMYRNDEEKLTIEDVIDILADIRHLCDLKELDIYHALDRSYDHYVSEIMGRE
jgi:hypothetical protein